MKKNEDIMFYGIAVSSMTTEKLKEVVEVGQDYLRQYPEPNPGIGIVSRRIARLQKEIERRGLNEAN